MEQVGIFCDHLVNFQAIWYLEVVGIFYVHLVFLLSFGILVAIWYIS
jgi:hypothetical protein